MSTAGRLSILQSVDRFEVLDFLCIGVKDQCVCVNAVKKLTKPLVDR